MYFCSLTVSALRFSCSMRTAPKPPPVHGSLITRYCSSTPCARQLNYSTRIAPQPPVHGNLITARALLLNPLCTAAQLQHAHCSSTPCGTAAQL